MNNWEDEFDFEGAEIGPRIRAHNSKGALVEDVDYHREAQPDVVRDDPSASLVKIIMGTFGPGVEVPLDKIVSRSGMTMNQVLEGLLSLEMSGDVHQHAGRKFSLVMGEIPFDLERVFEGVQFELGLEEDGVEMGQEEKDELTALAEESDEPDWAKDFDDLTSTTETSVSDDPVDKILEREFARYNEAAQAQSQKEDIDDWASFVGNLSPMKLEDIDWASAGLAKETVKPNEPPDWAKDFEASLRHDEMDNAPLIRPDPKRRDIRTLERENVRKEADGAAHIRLAEAIAIGLGQGRDAEQLYLRIRNLMAKGVFNWARIGNWLMSNRDMWEDIDGNTLEYVDEVLQWLEGINLEGQKLTYDEAKRLLGRIYDRLKTEGKFEGDVVEAVLRVMKARDEFDPRSLTDEEILSLARPEEVMDTGKPLGDGRAKDVRYSKHRGDMAIGGWVVKGQWAGGQLAFVEHFTGSQAGEWATKYLDYCHRMSRRGQWPKSVQELMEEEGVAP